VVTFCTYTRIQHTNTKNTYTCTHTNHRYTLTNIHTCTLTQTYLFDRSNVLLFTFLQLHTHTHTPLHTNTHYNTRTHYIDMCTIQILHTTQKHTYTCTHTYTHARTHPKQTQSQMYTHFSFKRNTLNVTNVL
jgi:hypothetical protein